MQARLEWVALGVVREVDVRGSFADEGMLSAAAWVRAHGRLAPRQAAGMVRTARALGSVPLAGASTALARGEVHAGHVQVIASGVAGAPAGAVGLIEPEALAVARESDPRAVAPVMRRFRQALDPERSDEEAVRRFERGGLTVVPTFDGCFAIGGLADEVTGAIIATAVDAGRRGGPAPVTGRGCGRARSRGGTPRCRGQARWAGRRRRASGATRTSRWWRSTRAGRSSVPGAPGGSSRGRSGRR